MIYAGAGAAETYFVALSGTRKVTLPPPRYSVTFALRRANFFGSAPFGTVRVMVSKPLGVFSATTTPAVELLVLVPTV